MGYLPALDGLRAVAIVGVLVFHTVPRRLPGGFTGVDVFFALSGYLIGRLILDQLRSGRFKFREFYLRRVLRIFPNLVLCAATTVVFWFLCLPASGAHTVARHAAWAVLGLGNVFVWSHLGGYWHDTAHGAPLTHTWSLGIEEQFYLLFPALLWGMSRLTARRQAAILGMIGAVSLAVCLRLTPVDPDSAFYLVHSRAWELLSGALLARATASLPAGIVPDPVRSLAGVLGLALVGASFVGIGAHQSFPGWIAAIPVLGAMLTIFGIEEGRGPVSRLLATSPVVAVGLRSYSLYLWHWPGIVAGRWLARANGIEEKWCVVAGLLAGVIVAELAYRFVENPVRHGTLPRAVRLRMIAIGTALTLAVTMGVGYLTHPDADPMDHFDPISVSMDRYDSGVPPAPRPWAPNNQYYDIEWKSRKGGSLWRDSGVVHAWGGAVPEVVVIGSSHAVMYGSVVDEICRKHGISVAFFCLAGTPVIIPPNFRGTFADVTEARSFAERRQALLAEWRPRVLICVDRWDAAFPEIETFGPMLDNFLAEVLPLVERVVIVSQVPTMRLGPGWNLRQFVTSYHRRHGEFPRLIPDTAEPARRRMIEIVEKLHSADPRVVLLRADREFYLPDGSVRYADARRFLYADDDHLTDQGAMEVRSLFEDAIAPRHDDRR